MWHVQMVHLALFPPQKTSSCNSQHTYVPMSQPPSDLQQPVRQLAAHPWFERLARFGYAAKGFVYFTIGLLAAQTTVGSGGKTTDTEGALASIVTQPFGKFLLSLVAVGLVGYCLWRSVQAILDPGHIGEELDAKRIVQRIGYAFSAIAYAGLTLTAVKLILGSAEDSGDATQDWTARLLAQPFGRWLVGLGGLVIIAVGLSYLYQAYKAKFLEEYRLEQMSRAEQSWAKRLGQIGVAARGIVFTLIGIFLLRAALQSDASEAKGFAEALAAIAQQPFGAWLLGLVALGLMVYSIHSVIEARYRQFVRYCD